VRATGALAVLGGCVVAPVEPYPAAYDGNWYYAPGYYSAPGPYYYGNSAPYYYGPSFSLGVYGGSGGHSHGGRRPSVRPDHGGRPGAHGGGRSR
jgi:hypothetical protein